MELGQIIGLMDPPLSDSDTISEVADITTGSTTR
jgi:hypothetical protein